jgi:hypothetical protein
MSKALSGGKPVVPNSAVENLALVSNTLEVIYCRCQRRRWVAMTLRSNCLHLYCTL